MTDYIKTQTRITTIIGSLASRYAELQYPVTTFLHVAAQLEKVDIRVMCDEELLHGLVKLSGLNRQDAINKLDEYQLA
jgi:hypothetical protein